MITILYNYNIIRIKNKNSLPILHGDDDFLFQIFDPLQDMIQVVSTIEGFDVMEFIPKLLPNFLIRSGLQIFERQTTQRVFGQSIIMTNVFDQRLNEIPGFFL